MMTRACMDKPDASAKRSDKGENQIPPGKSEANPPHAVTMMKQLEGNISGSVGETLETKTKVLDTEEETVAGIAASSMEEVKGDWEPSDDAKVTEEARLETLDTVKIKSGVVEETGEEENVSIKAAPIEYETNDEEEEQEEAEAVSLPEDNTSPEDNTPPPSTIMEEPYESTREATDILSTNDDAALSVESGGSGDEEAAEDIQETDEEAPAPVLVEEESAAADPSAAEDPSVALVTGEVFEQNRAFEERFNQIVRDAPLAQVVAENDEEAKTCRAFAIIKENWYTLLWVLAVTFTIMLFLIAGMKGGL